MTTARRKNTTWKNTTKQALKLQFRGESLLAFVDHTHKVTVYLMQGNKLKRGVSVMLQVEVLYEDGTLVASDTVLHLETQNFLIGQPLPHLQLSYRFKESSLLHGNRKFRLRVRPKEKYPGLLSAVTEPISVIKYQLTLKNLLPKKFFKDQGGRGKRMQLQVQLTNARGKPVRLEKSMPLVVILCYEESRIPVPNQAEILKLMGDSTPAIGTNGRAEILFRIQQVSSRHQLQNFALYIAPDVELCPLNGNVLAVYSSGVKVCSKRPGSTNRKRSRNVQYPQPGINPQIGKCMEAALAASKRPRVAPSDPEQAIDDMLKWSTYTCDVLRSIQCQPIGYELNIDGSPNLEMKIYRCPSCYQSSTGQQNNHTPDCTLNKIITMYTERVEPAIADILKRKNEEKDLIDFILKPSEDQLGTGITDDLNGNLNLDALTIDVHRSPGITGLTSQDSPNSLSLPSPQLLERANSIGEIWKDTQPPLIDIDSPRFLDSEHMVYYAYMKIFRNGGTGLGFPAFDRSFKLTGFFQEHAAAFHEPVIYIALSSLQVQRDQVSELEAELKSGLSIDSSDSKDLIKCLYDYKDLSEMKQDIVRFLPSRVVV